jgi:hypothetical protein
MSYFKDTDTWLDELLNILLPSEQDIEEFKKQMKEKLLESYRNGQAAQTTKDETPHEGNPRGASTAWRPRRKS